MINKIIRNFIAKQMAGRSDDGIMITLKDPQRVTLGENIMADLLIRNGIDPRLIKSEQELKLILQRIENAQAAAIRNTGIRNAESAKIFEITTGKEIPKGSKLMGGQAVDDMPPPGSRGGTDDIAAPVQSSEETLKNMIEAENKKAIDNLKQKMAKEKSRTQRISGNLRADNSQRVEIGRPKLDEDEYDYYREILGEDAEVDYYPVKGDETKEFLEAMVKEQKDEMNYMKRLYDKGALDDPEDFAKGGIARIGLKGGADAATESFSKSAGSSRPGRTGSVNISSSGGVTFDPGGRDDPVDDRSTFEQTVNQRKAPVKQKSGLEKIFDAGQEFNYLRNLAIGNFPGIAKQLLLNYGKQKLLDDQAMLDIEEDQNMMLAFEPGSIKDKQLKQMYNIFEETGMQDPRMKGLMKEDIEQGGPLSLPKEAYQMAADGGRIGFFMGSQFPKGLATLREMVKFFSKGKDKERSGSEILRLVNPKQFNKLLEDPNIYRKFDVQKGIGAPELIKNMQADLAKNRTMMVEEILGAAKNIRKADVGTMERKKEMIEEMMRRGIDRETAEEMANTLSTMAEAAAGKKLDAPKLTDEGILELENILKNMETGGKKKRDLNADGGRIGLKDGMNRRTFLKLLGGLASIPIIGKIIKPLKTVKGVKNVPIIKTDNVPGKPEWFDQLVNKVIIEGDDVTKRFATGERQSIHQKTLDDGSVVRVTEDVDDGAVRVEYESEANVFGDPVQMQYKKPLASEGDPRPTAEFTTAESGPVGRQQGPDDYEIEIDEVGGSSIRDLDSDVSKLKQYATGKGPTMKEIVQNKKRKDKAARISEDSEAQMDAIISRQGDYVDDDFSPDFARGGIARMLGE